MNEAIACSWARFESPAMLLKSASPKQGDRVGERQLQVRKAWQGNRKKKKQEEKLQRKLAKSNPETSENPELAQDDGGEGTESES